MKQKLCLILAILMLLLLAGCNISPSEAGEIETPSPAPSTDAPAAPTDTQQPQAEPSGPPAYYAAYAKIVQEHRDQYGSERIQQINSAVEAMNYLVGLCVVRLIDFDLDGTLELLLAWPESEEEYHSYRYAIWTSLDGETAEQICENQIFDGAEFYSPYIKLVERADGVFLGEDVEIPDAEEARVYRGISATGVSDALTLAYIPPYGQEEQSLVNGEAVSSEDYIKTETDFLSNAKVVQINFVLYSFEDIEPFNSTIQETRDALALLGIEVVEADSTTPDDATGDKASINYKPYTDLIDQYLLEYGQPQILPSSRWDSKDDVPALGGLCVVRLADLDGDGVEELILACAQHAAANGNQISYRYGIWALRDDAAEEIYLASLPGTAHEPGMILFADQRHIGINYDTNTEEATSAANVEFEARCYGYDGEKLLRAESFSEIPDDVLNSDETEWIYFSANSYRWAYGMDWDEDSERVLTKTQDTINLLVGASW